jgi:hypothetical protein
MIKTRLILIMFTLFCIYIQIPTSFISGKKCSEVCEADNRQINGRIFAVNGLLPCLVTFPPPTTATQPPHLDVGKNAAAVRDGTHL